MVFQTEECDFGVSAVVGSDVKFGACKTRIRWKVMDENEMRFK